MAHFSAELISKCIVAFNFNLRAEKNSPRAHNLLVRKCAFEMTLVSLIRAIYYYDLNENPKCFLNDIFVSSFLTLRNGPETFRVMHIMTDYGRLHLNDLSQQQQQFVLLGVMPLKLRPNVHVHKCKVMRKISIWMPFFGRRRA